MVPYTRIYSNDQVSIQFMIKASLLPLINFHQSKSYKINTSNKDKLAEFKKYLGREVLSETLDLPEPDTDAIQVIVYKASQFNEVLVDDTSLEIEGENIGINVKWMLDSLQNYIGKRASFRCLVGIHIADQVYVFEGKIPGTIVEKKLGPFGFGFLPYFKPDNAKQTLAEDLPDHLNARYFAVMDFLQNRPHQVCNPIFHWSGKFQNY
jgi:XTP/dITP diphosphohydrolase